jgi:peptidoglycan/LPS O-acetylase OafA/YrhL
MAKSNRFLELDVLRGLAALAVVLFHYTTRFDQLYGHPGKVWIEFPHGLYGVHLFFMISGFVIFMTLEKTRAPLDFVVSRLSRLYPAYWAAIILTFAVVSAATLPGRQVSMGQALINLLMWQFLFEVPHVDPVYWTLSVELSFYALMLILYKAKLLKRIESIAAVWLLVMALTSMAERHFGTSVPDKIKVMLLLEYAHLFIAGMIFYRLMKHGLSVRKGLILAACLVVQRIMTSWELTLMVGIFFLAFHLAVKGRLSFMIWRPLVFLGAVSYALYLVHQNIGYVVLRALYKQQLNPNVSIAVAVILSLCVASAITFMVERPALQAIRTAYAQFRESRVARASTDAATTAGMVRRVFLRNQQSLNS